MTMMRKHPIVRVLLLASATLLAGVISIAPSHAKTDFGVRGGTYTESDQPFLGAEALFGVGAENHWFGNPNLEHAFADNGSLTTVSFDFHYDFPTGHAYTIWAGAGPTVIFRDANGPANAHDTNPGMNLVFGIGAKKGDVRPYGQMKVVVADVSEAVLGIGARF